MQEIEPHEREAAYSSLRLALEPGRLKLLTQFNELPEGVKFLVDLRADLSRLTKRVLRLDPWMATCVVCWRRGSISDFLNCAVFGGNHLQVYLKN